MEWIKDINEYHGLFWPILGFIALAYAYISPSNTSKVRCEWNAVAGFCAFMVIISIIRLGIWDVNHDIPGIPRGVGMFNFLLVWLEDAYFVLIPWLISLTTKRKWLKFLVWTLSSVLFASGHIYIGLVWAVCTLFYPYFISYNYGKKYGLGTVMLCHIIYDSATVITAKLAPYILL